MRRGQLELLGDTQARILRLLLGAPAGLSVPELYRRLGQQGASPASEHAVRRELQLLAARHLVSQHVKAGHYQGKPVNLYQADQVVAEPLLENKRLYLDWLKQQLA